MTVHAVGASQRAIDICNDADNQRVLRQGSQPHAQCQGVCVARRSAAVCHVVPHLPVRSLHTVLLIEHLLELAVQRTMSCLYPTLQ